MNVPQQGCARWLFLEEKATWRGASWVQPLWFCCNARPFPARGQTLAQRPQNAVEPPIAVLARPLESAAARDIFAAVNPPLPLCYIFKDGRGFQPSQAVRKAVRCEAQLDRMDA